MVRFELLKYVGHLTRDKGVSTNLDYFSILKMTI